MKRVNIIGMSCRNCANSVEEVLSRLEAVEDVRVNLEDGYADIIGAVREDDIIEAVTKLGFTVASIGIPH